MEAILCLFCVRIAQRGDGEAEHRDGVQHPLGCTGFRATAIPQEFVGVCPVEPWRSRLGAGVSASCLAACIRRSAEGMPSSSHCPPSPLPTSNNCLKHSGACRSCWWGHLRASRALMPPCHPCGFLPTPLHTATCPPLPTG